MSLGSVASLGEWRSVLMRNEEASNRVIEWIKERKKKHRQATNQYEVLDVDEDMEDEDGIQDSVEK